MALGLTADLHAKAIVSTYLFQGDRRSKDALDNVLIETRDEKKSMPTALNRADRRFLGILLSFPTNPTENQ